MRTRKEKKARTRARPRSMRAINMHQWASIFVPNRAFHFERRPPNTLLLWERDETPYQVGGQVFQASDRENQDEWDHADVPGNGRDQGDGLY